MRAGVIAPEKLAKGSKVLIKLGANSKGKYRGSLATGFYKKKNDALIFAKMKILTGATIVGFSSRLLTDIFH
jgi:hypothetical protein